MAKQKTLSDVSFEESMWKKQKKNPSLLENLLLQPDIVTYFHDCFPTSPLSFRQLNHELSLPSFTSQITTLRISFSNLKKVLSWQPQPWFSKVAHLDIYKGPRFAEDLTIPYNFFPVLTSLRCSNCSKVCVDDKIQLHEIFLKCSKWFEGLEFNSSQLTSFHCIGDQTSEKILPILERVKGQLTSLKLCQVPISWQYMMEVLASSPQLQVLQMDCIDFPIQEHVSICLPFFLEQAELVFHRAVRSLQMTCSESLQSLDVTASVNSFGLVHGESLKKLRLVSRTEAIVQFWSHRPSFPNLQSLELRHSNNNYREFHTSSLFFTDLPMLQELTCDLEWYHFAVCNLPKLHTCRFSKNLWRATVVFENLPLLTLIQLREVREVRIENLPLLQTLQVFFSPDDECFLKAIGTPCLSCLRVRNFDSFGSNVDPFPQLQELTVDIGDVSHFVNLTRYSPLLKDVELFQSRPRKNWYSWYSNTEELVQYLSTFPVLSKLTLNYLGETQLKMVTGFPMLEEVVIEGSLSTIQLEQMDRLRFLFVGPADTVMLCNLPLLSKCSIHSRFHIAVENAPQLESLEAKFAETFYATQISICQVPSLRCLVLKNFLFGNPLCDASIALEKPLWRAELEVSRSSPQLLPCVTGTSQLSLRVLDPALMHELSQLPNLLHLEICGLQDDSLVVDGFPSLTFLHFFRDCILDDLKVQCLPKLEQLWLFKHEDLSSIKNVSLDSLANLSKVVVLKHHHALNIYASNLPQFTELQTCSATKLIVSSRDTIPRFQMNNRVKLLLKE